MEETTALCSAKWIYKKTADKISSVDSRTK